MAFEVIEGGTVTTPLDFKAGVAACGLKEPGRFDLALLYSEQDCTAAGLFTQNQVAAAPVILDRETLAANQSRIRGVAANAGIANACTGEGGMVAAREMQQAAAGLLDCRPEQMLVLSTGVIGVPLPMGKVGAGLRVATEMLSEDNGVAAAQAIMTTDTRPKYLALKATLPGGEITMGGLAKGAGMIHPNMATMLAVITTDAAISAVQLKDQLRIATNDSFNRISVDGDTSTNDSVLLLANGASGVTVDDRESLACFAEVLGYVCVELAKMIVRDGEGVTKFVEVQVTGAVSSAAAHRVAETIATSPLVKTALAGSDANWGRILAAAGRAGVPFDQDLAALWVGNPDGPALQLVRGGTPTDYAEADAAAIFARPEINVRLDLGRGESEAIMWTCDLTHEYVTINADYRT